jgi:hypothetical protein
MESPILLQRAVFSIRVPNVGGELVAVTRTPEAIAAAGKLIQSCG